MFGYPVSVKNSYQRIEYSIDNDKSNFIFFEKDNDLEQVLKKIYEQACGAIFIEFSREFPYYKQVRVLQNISTYLSQIRSPNKRQ